MVFTLMVVLVQMELEFKRERITDSVAKRRATGQDLGRRGRIFTDSQLLDALWLIESEEPATQVARDLGMSWATIYRRIRELPMSTAQTAGSFQVLRGVRSSVAPSAPAAVTVRTLGSSAVVPSE